MDSYFAAERFKRKVSRYRKSVLRLPKSETIAYRRSAAMVLALYAQALTTKALAGHKDRATLLPKFAEIWEHEVTLLDPHWRRDHDAIQALLSDASGPTA
ncbi:hypothetical protein KW835_13680 [Acidovorax sp. sic0104]|nr:hypothetical protein [Acidovorax sp. sic0104]